MPLHESGPPPAGISWGLIPRDPERKLRAAMSARPVSVPRSEWQPVSLRHHVWHIFRQLDGHCASNAAVLAMMIKRRMQGLRDVVLSPEALYARHSRWGTGSTLAENLEYLLAYGVPSRESMPAKNYGRLSDYGEHNAEARVYRPLEYLDCSASVDDCGAALQAGHPLIIGTRAFGGGHSVVATEMERDGSTWYFGGPNSWGESWGDRGFWRYSERRLRDIAGWGTWAITSVLHDEWSP